MSLSVCTAGTPDFLARFWSRRPVLERGSADRYSALFGEDAVDDLVTSRGLRLPAFRMVRQGELLDPGRYTRTASLGHGQVDDLIDPASVIRLFQDGATLILRGLHRYHAGISGFCDAFARELGHPVQANAYVTPPDAQGFAVHYDKHDVFVLQCSGTKRWTVYEPPHPHPPTDDEVAQYVQPDDLGDMVIDDVLRPGDTLYIPRGWPHRAVTGNATSIHLTVGVLVLTWLDVLGIVLGKARSSPALRATIPTPVDGGAFKEGFLAASAAFTALLGETGIAELDEDLQLRIRSHQGPLVPGAWVRRT